MTWKEQFLWSKSLELLWVGSKPRHPQHVGKDLRRNTPTSGQEALLGPVSYTNPRRVLLLLEEGRKLLSTQDLSKIQGRVWLPGEGGGESLRESPNWNPKHRTFLGQRWARRTKKPPPPFCPSPTTRVANPKWRAIFIFFWMRGRSIERDPLWGTDK